MSKHYGETQISRLHENPEWSNWGTYVFFTDSHILLLHPTKTGGTTIEHCLMQTLKDSVTPHSYMPLQHLNEDRYDEHLDFKRQIMFGNYRDTEFPAFSLQHACLVTAKRLLGDATFDAARKVAIVRSPYTRMVSLFFYYGFYKGSTFATFVREKLPIFARSSANLAVNFAAKQTLYTHQSGARVADIILRQESMEESIAMLSHFLSLPIRYDANMRWRKSNASLEFDNYMDAYDDESLAVVRTLYEDDFKLLGYDP